MQQQHYSNLHSNIFQLILDDFQLLSQLHPFLHSNIFKLIPIQIVQVIAVVKFTF